MSTEDLDPTRWDSKTYLKYNSERVGLAKLIASHNLNELQKKSHRNRHVLVENATKKYERLHFPVQNQYS